jgi:uncharacterized lipoprotein YmbA
MKSTRVLLLLALVALTGCFSLSREPPLEQYYVLGGSAPEESQPLAERLAGLAVGLRQLQLADYLDTPLIVVRQGPQEIRFAEFHRWGEGLGVGVNRAVAGYLASRAPLRGVDVVPWPPRTPHDYLIQLYVLRFEGLVPEGEAYLLADWKIIDPQNGAVLDRGTTDYRARGWTVGAYDELAALLDAGVRQLSDDLVASLETLAAP